MSDTKETESYTTVELTLDNDEVIECAILTVYEAAGKEYIALLPLDENLEPNEAGDVYLYQYNETEDGEPDLGNIEDDDEYEIAADAFDVHKRHQRSADLQKEREKGIVVGAYRRRGRQKDSGRSGAFVHAHSSLPGFSHRSLRSSKRHRLSFRIGL